jgi:hypothetical protein
LEHTAQQISAVKAEFARLRRLTAIGLFIMSLPLYGVVFSLRTGPILGMGANTWLLAWVAVAAVVGLIFARIWRCPACGTSLGQPPSVSVCRKCGVAFK